MTTFPSESNSIEDQGDGDGLHPPSAFAFMRVIRGSDLLGDDLGLVQADNSSLEKFDRDGAPHLPMAYRSTGLGIPCGRSGKRWGIPCPGEGRGEKAVALLSSCVYLSESTQQRRKPAAVLQVPC